MGTIHCQLLLPDGTTRLPFNVHADVTDPVSHSIASSGVWESFESELTWKSLRPGDCFIDIGANIGYFSALAAVRVGHAGQVVAFEPEQNNHALLATNAALNAHSNYTLHAVAASDSDGAGELFLNPENLGDHQIYASGDRAAQTILLRRIDSLLAPQTVINLIKIDVQGAEQKAMAGMADSLARNASHLLLLLEFWPRGLARAGGDAHQLLHMLLALGLKPYVVEHIKHVLLDGPVSDIEAWIDDVMANAQNEGFLNLLFAGPAAQLPDVPIVRAPY
jgi:FkbM family methyltransferase